MKKLLFFRGGDVGGATVIGEDDWVLIAVVIKKRDVKFVGESVNNSGANAKAGEGAWTGEESDLFKVLPGFMVVF